MREAVSGGHMEIRIVRSQEPRKGMLGGKGLRLAVDIAVTLESDEQELVARYFDPFINWRAGDAAAELFKPIKETSTSADLSGFRVRLQTDEGFDNGALLQRACDEIEKTLRAKLTNLVALASWEGEQVIEVRPVLDAIVGRTD